MEIKTIVLDEKVDIDILYRLIHSKKLLKWDSEQKEKLMESNRIKNLKDIENLVKNELNNQYELEKEKDPKLFFTTKPIQQYIESVNLSSSTVQVEYKVYGYGRFKNITSMGVPYSYTNMFSEIRNLSAYKYVYDIDIKNCHASLLVNICNENNIECNNLIDFCKKRNNYIIEIMEQTKKFKKDIKNFFNKLLYKFNDNIESSFYKEFNTTAPIWIIKLKNEIKIITPLIITNSKYKNIYEWKIKDMKEKNKIYNKEGKILSVIIQELERQVLIKLYLIVSNDNIKVRTLIHDGMHIDKMNGELTIELLQNKLISWISKVNIFFEFIYPIELLNKEMEIDESYLETTIDFNNYYRHKLDFEKKYFKIKSPLMYRYNTIYNITIDDIKDIVNNQDKAQYIAEFFSYDRFIKHEELIKSEQDHQYKNFINKWIEDPYKRQYDTLLFYPFMGNISPLSNNIFNTFDGYEITKYIKAEHKKHIGKALIIQKRTLANKCYILLNHLIKLGKDENGFNFLCNWIAHILQYPNKKTCCCVVLKGKQGKGKNTLFNILKGIIGEKYCVETPNIEHIYGKFAGCRADKLLILLDEIEFKNTKEEIGKIKTSITTDNFILEKKGIDGIPYKSYENYIFASNNDLCIPIEESNRRFFVIDVNCINYGNDNEMKEYFDNIYKVLGDKKMGINPQYDILEAFYKYMLLIEDVDKYDFRKAIIDFSKDAKSITTKNPVDTFLEQLLYKESENNFEIRKFSKEIGNGIRKKIINNKEYLQAIYKQSYLFKEYNSFYRSISNKESNLHNNMFSREITKDKEYIKDIKTDGINVFIIDIEEWKLAYNFKKSILDEYGEIFFE